MSSVSVDNRAGWGLRSALTIGLLASAGCAGEPGADEPAALCDPGRATLHRLNRSEYNNTVRDLLGDETLLAGRGGGALGPGRHVRYPKGTPVANLYISMLAAVGAKADSFGDDGTGPLPDLA